MSRPTDIETTAKITTAAISAAQILSLKVSFLRTCELLVRLRLGREAFCFLTETGFWDELATNKKHTP
jgi:hypothetical protein